MRHAIFAATLLLAASTGFAVEDDPRPLGFGFGDPLVDGKEGGGFLVAKKKVRDWSVELLGTERYGICRIYATKRIGGEHEARQVAATLIARYGEPYAAWGGYKRWNVNKGKLETVTLEFDDSFVAVGYWSTFMEACEVDGEL